MLGKVGVKVNLFAQTKSKHFKELKDNQGDFYMLGWGVPTLDSHYVFHYLYETGASWNRVNFSNAEVDAAASTSALLKLTLFQLAPVSYK